MLKAPVLIETEGGIKNLRQLTVSEAVYFCESFYQRGRIDLLQDLDDAKASPETRFEQLRTFAKEKGMASYLIRQVFNVKNAKELILHVADGKSQATNLSILPLDVWVTKNKKRTNQWESWRRQRSRHTDVCRSGNQVDRIGICTRLPDRLDRNPFAASL